MNDCKPAAHAKFTLQEERKMDDELLVRVQLALQSTYTSHSNNKKKQSNLSLRKLYCDFKRSQQCCELHFL